MSLAFKHAAHVPHGVTPEQVLAELDDIRERYGRNGPDVAADAVLKEPDRYPALRAFCPDTPEDAFREAVRRAVTYAVRIIVEVTDADEPVEVRVLYVVTDDEGLPDYQPLRVIASDERRKLELLDELDRDLTAQARKQRNVLAEIRRLLGG